MLIQVLCPVFIDEGARAQSKQPSGPAAAKTWGMGAPKVKFYMAVVVIGIAAAVGLGLVEGRDVHMV